MNGWMDEWKVVSGSVSRFSFLVCRFSFLVFRSLGLFGVSPEDNNNNNNNNNNTIVTSRPVASHRIAWRGVSHNQLIFLTYLLSCLILHALID
ncbi:hypothetical protein K504DRAFT_465191 [Pleomassaria siparia CBS 279.74]|uniref:Uncharacterized protein n=1 Tax=Pleomassaria siparia CBS 279.74 TaxID=1314801 RepID=A0A6G1KF32_9PLEO|nr:hypothetical protein K504DRAFT_465191 [Pleomassaria siparia CBS 279.74]